MQKHLVTAEKMGETDENVCQKQKKKKEEGDEKQGFLTKRRK